MKKLYSNMQAVRSALCQRFHAETFALLFLITLLAFLYLKDFFLNWDLLPCSIQDQRWSVGDPASAGGLD